MLLAECLPQRVRPFFLNNNRTRVIAFTACGSLVFELLANAKRQKSTMFKESHANCIYVDKTTLIESKT